MEDFDFGWLGDDYPLNHETPKSVFFEDSPPIPRANPAAELTRPVETACPAPERADQPSQSNERGDNSDPDSIRYDFRWKVS